MSVVEMKSGGLTENTNFFIDGVRIPGIIDIHIENIGQRIVYKLTLVDVVTSGYNEKDTEGKS